ncbi:hypothetical protein BH10ACT2_BH10ACT2_21370 [soil metagenome]
MDHLDVAEVLAELTTLRQRVADLEAQLPEANDEVESSAQDRSTRRGMLRLAGAAVAGGAAASLLGAQPAAATPGIMNYGLSQDSGTDTTTLSSTSSSKTLFVINSTTTGVGIVGTANGNGTGLVGTLDSPDTNGYAVWGDVSGSKGIAVVATGGAAQLGLGPYAGDVAPSSDTHYGGELVANQGGIWYCVAAGSPGSWRKLAGVASAGAFHAITPTRVYDSRAAAPIPGTISTGSNRTISVADGRNGSGVVTTANLVPAGATAVAANITVTGTVGRGYLAINPGGNLVEGASTINWSATGLTIANGVSLTLNASRQLTVICNGGGGSTHFIVDIAGYYL